MATFQPFDVIRRSATVTATPRGQLAAQPDIDGALVGGAIGGAVALEDVVDQPPLVLDFDGGIFIIRMESDSQVRGQGPGSRRPDEERAQEEECGLAVADELPGEISWWPCASSVRPAPC